MTEDDAYGWLKDRKIRIVCRPSTYVDEPGYRYRLMRESAPAPLPIVVPEKAVLSLVTRISFEAWEKYPTKASTPLAHKLWAFFEFGELQDLYSQLLD